ncbi:MAG TPA: DNA polymerase III subunit epsilon [Kiloniellales bacterium]|nr:DNA polymerase III subunit epsilon [Kiloniellales bacterium]
MTREIVLDTETTGLDPADGHRIVEIGCLELVNHLPTGRHYRQYVNPEREMPEDAFRVHGLSDDFLRTHPTFAEVVEQFLEFIGDARLVIHNANFDLRFINAELARIRRPPLDLDRALDTVQMARSKFPGAQASLDALCRRFSIDNSARTLHGALLDCELLAEVYLELIGGRQPSLVIEQRIEVATLAQPIVVAAGATARAPRVFAPAPEELLAHAAMLAKLKDAIWLS